MQERNEVWEARTGAEIEVRHAKTEEQLREQTEGADCNTGGCSDNRQSRASVAPTVQAKILQTP